MTDQNAAFSGTKPVEERHRLDDARLDAWLRQHVDGFEGPLEVRQFKGGQSNPTYELVTPGRSYVLRRKPWGKLLPSAHAVDREFRVISALHPSGFPVARPYALCQDAEVIGADFYVMEKVEGRILWEARMPDQPREARAPLYAAQIETLARLHAADPVALGLGDFGKPGNYFGRQVERWSRQYRASETGAVPAMDRLLAYLPDSLPPDGATAIVHGDYRLDNLILDAREPRVRAVLDWELSTLGDPLADFTYFLMQWVLPPNLRGGMAGLDLDELGIPTIDQAVEQYCALTGRSGVPSLDWCFAYNLFRLAAILQGIAGRVRDGTAASPHALEMAEKVEPLAEAAWSFARKAGA